MRTLLLILSLFFTISYAEAQESIRGNFDALNGVPKMHSMEKFVFEEFLNFGCPHCNNFRMLSQEMKEKYKNRVEFIDVPILFRGQADAPLRLFYVAKSLGKAESVKNAIFEAQFKHGVDVFDPGIINYLARSLGMGKEYSRDAQSAEITQKIKDSEQKATRYGIQATPTIVLAETLRMKIGGSMEEFVENLPQTFDDLLK
ncbi:MAG: DsbA family protein [SAR324 cluster bacterium]|nr:DsbA family protein [SAR324 cluster bacterium]